MIADGNRCIDVPGTETIKGVKYFNYNDSFDRWKWYPLIDGHFTNEDLLESNVLLNNQVKLVSFEFRLFGLYITETSRYSGFLKVYISPRLQDTAAFLIDLRMAFADL